MRKCEVGDTLNFTKSLDYRYWISCYYPDACNGITIHGSTRELIVDCLGGNSCQNLKIIERFFFINFFEKKNGRTKFFATAKKNKNDGDE